MVYALHNEPTVTAVGFEMTSGYIFILIDIELFSFLHNILKRYH